MFENIPATVQEFSVSSSLFKYLNNKPEPFPFIDELTSLDIVFCDDRQNSLSQEYIDSVLIFQEDSFKNLERLFIGMNFIPMETYFVLHTDQFKNLK